MATPTEEQCPHCGGFLVRSRACGVLVCGNDNCGWHKGLTRCFCGWAKDGGDGRQQLEDLGEQIEEDY